VLRAIGTLARGVHDGQDGEPKVHEGEQLPEVRHGARDVLGGLLPVRRQIVLGVVRHDDAGKEDSHEARQAQVVGDDEGQVRHAHHDRHLGVCVRVFDAPFGDDGGKEPKGHAEGHGAAKDPHKARQRCRDRVSREVKVG